MQQLTEKELSVDGEFEPEQILAYVIDYFKSEPNKAFVYLSEINRHLREHYNTELTGKGLAKLARQAGYKVSHHRFGFAVDF